MHTLWWTCFLAAARTLVVVRAFSTPVQNAKPAPYMCQLRSSPTKPLKCQGVLVDADFAVFSRICMQSYKPGDSVVVGPTWTNGGLDDGEWIPVLGISPHRTLDFAMVMMMRSAKATPVGILWDELEPGAIAWMRGWNPSLSDNATKVLVETPVQVLSNDQCVTEFKNPVSSDLVCGDNDWFYDCSSYIYGSLFVEIDGKDFLVGLMYSFWCNFRPMHQVFSRISSARSLIQPYLCLGK